MICFSIVVIEVVFYETVNLNSMDSVIGIGQIVVQVLHPGAFAAGVVGCNLYFGEGDVFGSILTGRLLCPGMQEG